MCCWLDGWLVVRPKQCGRRRPIFLSRLHFQSGTILDGYSIQSKNQHHHQQQQKNGLRKLLHNVMNTVFGLVWPRIAQARTISLVVYAFKAFIHHTFQSRLWNVLKKSRIVITHTSFLYINRLCVCAFFHSLIPLYKWIFI